MNTKRHTDPITIDFQKGFLAGLEQAALSKNPPKVHPKTTNEYQAGYKKGINSAQDAKVVPFSEVEHPDNRNYRTKYNKK